MNSLMNAGNVLVGDNLALPLFHAHHTLRHLDLQVALHLALASQTPVVLDLLAGEVRLLRIENLAAALEHLNLTLATACLTAAGRRQEDAVLIQRSHQTAALRHVDGLVAIDFDIYISARAQILLSHEQDDNQQENHHEENSDTSQYK